MTLETFLIKPTNKYNRPPPPPKIKLHGLDLLSAPIQIRINMFFSNTPYDILEVLKSSLAEALELYSPVTGIMITEGNENTYISTVHCMDTPLLFETRNVSYSGDDVDISPRGYNPLSPSDSIFAAKVTKFSCGTIAIGTSMNHQVCDLRGTLDFLELWAKIARNDSIDLDQIPSDWHRTPGRFFSGLTNGNVVTTAPPPFFKTPTPQGLPPFLMVASNVTRWKFTKSSMKQLKDDFSSFLTDSWISSGDALAAIVVGVIARSRENANVPRLEGRSSLESGVESIAMAADGRERAPLGNMAGGHYFGNFNCLWSFDACRSDLLSSDCEAGSRVASAIRRNLNNHLAPESIARKIEFFESSEGGYISWSADIILTNWCRFDLQGPTFDFGWGKPFQSTNGAGGFFPPGYCLMSQDKESGDVTIMITIEEQGAQELKNDPMLNKYANLIN